MKKTERTADRYHAEAKAPFRGGCSFPTQQQVVILPVDVLDEKLEELATRLEDRLRGSPVEQDETLTAKEAREILHISSKQFYLLRKEGRIQYFQSGRKILVYRSEIDRYINSHSHNTI